MHKTLETLAFNGPLKLRRQQDVTTLSSGTVKLQADVDLDTGEVKLVVSDQDLKTLRQDAAHSVR